MASRNEHLVVIMLEPFQPGKEFEQWTLHITIVPWFPCDDEQKLDLLLSKIASRHRSFEVEAGRVRLFGNKNKYPVVPVNDPGNLHRLHWDVFYSLEKNGFPVHQKEHLGPNYRPHFIYHDYNPIKTGDKIKINSFALIKQVRQKKTGTMIKSVVKEYFLG